MPALQRKAAWAEQRLLRNLRQSVPETRRVHLLGIELRAQQRQVCIKTRPLHE